MYAKVHAHTCTLWITIRGEFCTVIISRIFHRKKVQELSPAYDVFMFVYITVQKNVLMYDARSNLAWGLNSRSKTKGIYCKITYPCGAVTRSYLKVKPKPYSKGYCRLCMFTSYLPFHCAIMNPYKLRPSRANGLRSMNHQQMHSLHAHLISFPISHYPALRNFVTHQDVIYW